MRQLTNPILDADWPDPDAIRVGDDYYLVASSFNRTPGLPVLHSTDLVRWEIVCNALRELTPLDHFAVPRHGGGVWAPSIRLHNGVYFIVYPDPDHGIHVLTAPDPGGEWSRPHLLMPGPGRIDPCPLWDDDGRTYLVHAWAMSRSGLKNRLTVVEVSEDLRPSDCRRRRRAARVPHPGGSQVLQTRRVVLDLRARRRSCHGLAVCIPVAVTLWAV